MAPSVTHREVDLPYDVPGERTGPSHVVRDEVPALYPEISDFRDRQERHEQAVLDALTDRGGQIAVADSIELRLEAFAS